MLKIHPRLEGTSQPSQEILSDSLNFPSVNLSNCNISNYVKSRSKRIDNESLKEWSGYAADLANLPESSSSHSDEQFKLFYEEYKILIRKGVPDCLKCLIFLKPNGAAAFAAKHPNFLPAIFHNTFGDSPPSLTEGRCPTFCCGILGLQEDILGIEGSPEDFEGGSERYGSFQVGDAKSSFSGGGNISSSAFDLLRQWFSGSPQGVSPALTPKGGQEYVGGGGGRFLPTTPFSLGEDSDNENWSLNNTSINHANYPPDSSTRTLVASAPNWSSKTSQKRAQKSAVRRGFRVSPPSNEMYAEQNNNVSTSSLGSPVLKSEIFGGEVSSVKHRDITSQADLLSDDGIFGSDAGFMDEEKLLPRHPIDYRKESSMDDSSMESFDSFSDLSGVSLTIANQRQRGGGPRSSSSSSSNFRFSSFVEEDVPNFDPLTISKTSGGDLLPLGVSNAQIDEKKMFFRGKNSTKNNSRLKEKVSNKKTSSYPRPPMNYGVDNSAWSKNSSLSLRNDKKPVGFAKRLLSFAVNRLISGRSLKKDSSAGKNLKANIRERGFEEAVDVDAGGYGKDEQTASSRMFSSFSGNHPQGSFDEENSSFAHEKVGPSLIHSFTDDGILSGRPPEGENDVFSLDRGGGNRRLMNVGGELLLKDFTPWGGTNPSDKANTPSSHSRQSALMGNPQFHQGERGRIIAQTDSSLLYKVSLEDSEDSQFRNIGGDGVCGDSSLIPGYSENKFSSAFPNSSLPLSSPQSLPKPPDGGGIGIDAPRRNIPMGPSYPRTFENVSVGSDGSQGVGGRAMISSVERAAFADEGGIRGGSNVRDDPFSYYGQGRMKAGWGESMDTHDFRTYMQSTHYQQKRGLKNRPHEAEEEDILPDSSWPPREGDVASAEDRDVRMPRSTSDLFLNSLISETDLQRYNSFKSEGGHNFVDVSGGRKHSFMKTMKAAKYGRESADYRGDEEEKCFEDTPEKGNFSMKARQFLKGFFGNLGAKSSSELKSVSARKSIEGADPQLEADGKLTQPQAVSTQKSPDIFDLEQVTDFYMLLSESGRISARSLLWCLNTLHSHEIDFCPLLPHLTCVLLLYMPDNESFSVLHCIMKKSVAAIQHDRKRPYLLYRRSDFVRFIKLMLNGITYRQWRLYNHLRSLGVDLAAWIARAVQDGFARMLPFDYVLQIYGAFLFEGCKIFYRYCLAILKFLKKPLLNCRRHSEAEYLLYNVTSQRGLRIDLLTKLAYSIRIRSSPGAMMKHSESSPSPYLISTHVQHLYRPRLKEQSAILTNSDWEFLWSSIPTSSRILDPIKCYDSSSDGVSISSLIMKLKRSHRKPTIVCIKTFDADVFGFYLPFQFSFDNRLQREDAWDSFIFSLDPIQASFWWTGKNDMFVRCSSEYISIGGDDAALYLDDSLYRGNNKASISFDSPKIVKNELGDFEAKVLEVWMLD